MIRYALICEHEHEFEGWFGSSTDFDDQQARGIFGQATGQEVRELVEDGVPVAPLPPEPPKKAQLN